MIESHALAPGEHRFFADCDQVEQVFEVAGGRAVFATQRSPFRERPNEDAAAIFSLTSTTAVLAIADGAGGMPGGGTASRMALEALGECLGALKPKGLTFDELSSALRAAVLDGFEAANAQVLAKRSGSATTLMVAAIQAGRVRIVHAGDSIGLLSGQRGRLKYQTVAHSPTGYAYESGLFDELEAAEHPDRHLVCNMLGIPELRVEVGPQLELAPRDTLVLASDGLSDNLLLEEIVGTICTGPLPSAHQELFRRCREHMLDGIGPPEPHPDDLAILAFRPTPQSARLSIVKG